MRILKIMQHQGSRQIPCSFPIQGYNLSVVLFEHSTLNTRTPNAMSPLPSGTVTFLFTDVERSTQMWDHFPELMRPALARHDSLIAEVAARHNGKIVKERGEGDSMFLTFDSAVEAAHAAIAIQNALRTEAWPPDTLLKVRMALHTGETHERDGDYYGGTVNRCGRIRAVGNGGHILLSEVTAGLVRDHLTGCACLRDHGQHHLKDLQRPEHIFELRDDRWTDDFGPLRSLAAFKHNLPLQLTSFVGREQELKNVRTFMTQTRLLTLQGSGGCGKTRLALQAAAEAVDDYPDGVWSVTLAPLAEDELVVRAIANALGIKEEPGREGLQTLCDALQKQTLLLLLDNCEHLVKAVAKVATALLQTCPGLHILATSRRKLNVAGEKCWNVPLLPVPGDTSEPTVEDALRNESVRLFVERATSASADFALTTANLPAVTRICRRVEGIPLAIELAAAWVHAYSPQIIDSRLNNFFSLLVGGSGEKRHETLTALIDWSYDLLTDEERVLLRRLSVFAGGWTLETMEAVCEWGELETGTTFNLLFNLINASLVITGEQEDAQRYRLLETVRQYATKKLEAAGETEAARDAHLRCFLDMAEEAEPKLTGPEQAFWLRTLEAEHDNLRTALKWAIHGETRLRMTSALWRFWATRYLEEGRGWIEGALRYSPHASPTCRAKGLNALGVLVVRQGDYVTGQQLLLEALTLREQHGTQREIAEVHNNLGHVYFGMGSFEEARNCYTTGLDLRKADGDTWGMAGSLTNLGMLARQSNDIAEARQYFEQAFASYRALDDTQNIATVLTNLGVVLELEGSYSQARQHYEDALQVYTTLKNHWGATIALHNLSTLARKQKDNSATYTFALKSAILSNGQGDKEHFAHSLCNLADAYFEARQYPHAVYFYSAADTWRLRLGIVLVHSEETDDEEANLTHLHSVVNTGLFQAQWAAGETASQEEILLYAREFPIS